MHRLRGDRGAVAVLVALLVPVVLLGLGAIVLDFGKLYAEKRQLQNGADAGALAVAREYASSLAQTCVAGAKVATADDYADRNANDTAGSAIKSVECPAGNKVRVTTSTLSSDGGFIKPVLAQLLGAGPSTLEATAAAAWGAPHGLTSGLPLTISACEFQAYTTSGLAVGPPFDPALERVLHFHSQDHVSGCPASKSGQDAAGGFGWVDTPETTCATTTSFADPTLDADVGLSVPSACTSAYFKSLVGTVVSVPIFSKTNGLTGNNIVYTLSRFEAFYLTGYKLSGGPEYTMDSPTLPSSKDKTTLVRNCDGEERCIYGYFTKDPTPGSGTVGSGTSAGVTIVQLTD